MARNLKFKLCVLFVILGMLSCSKTVRQENGYLAGSVTVEGAGVSGVTISVSAYTTSSGNAKVSTLAYSAMVSEAGDFRIELLAGDYRVDFDLILDGETLHTARYPVKVEVGIETPIAVDLKDPVPQNLVAKDDDASVLLTWEHAYGASSYKVFRALESERIFNLIAITDSALGTVRYVDAPPEIDIYAYKVSAVANEIESANSEEAVVLFTGTISPPTGFSASDNITHVLLEWTSKSFASYYKIYRTTAGSPDQWALIDSTAQSSYQDIPETYDSYLYHITAVSFLNMESAPSSSEFVEYDGIYDPPSGVILLDRGSNFYLTWLEEDNVSYYNIYRSDIPDSDFVKIDSSFVSYYEDFPQLYGYYYYAVSIMGPNGLESEKSEVVGAYYDGRLDPPDQVFATDLGLSVEVSWSEVLWAAFYIVYRSDDDGSTYNQISRVNGEEISTIDMPPAAGNYYYKVKTETLDGVAGSLSNAANVYYSNNLPSPVNVIAENFGTFVLINWDEVPEADCYNVYRSTTAGGAYSLLGSSIDPEYSDTPQMAGAYYYKVRATDTIGHESPFSFYAFTYFTDLPQAPFNVSAEDLQFKVRVNWESIDSSFIFIISRSNSSNGDYFPIDTVEGELEIIDWPSTEDHYYYKVQAEHPSHGTSEFSQYGHVYFSGILDFPSNLLVSDEGTYIAISWEDVEGAAEYDLFRGISDANLDVIQTIYISNATDVPDSADTYYYAVRARTQGGLESPTSGPVAVVFSP